MPRSKAILVLVRIAKVAAIIRIASTGTCSCVAHVGVARNMQEGIKGLKEQGSLLFSEIIGILNQLEARLEKVL